MSTIIESALDTIIAEMQGLQHVDTGKFMVDPTTSEAIKAVLIAERAVKQAKQIMVERFTKAALEYDPNFKGIEGNGVRASYKAGGAAFKVVDPTIVPEAVLKVTHSVDAAGLKAWQKKNGGATVLPWGIEPITERTMSLSFTFSDKPESEEE